MPLPHMRPRLSSAEEACAASRTEATTSFTRYLRALERDLHAVALADILDARGVVIAEPTDLAEFIGGHTELFCRITIDEWRAGSVVSSQMHFWRWWDIENHVVPRPLRVSRVSLRPLAPYARFFRS